MSVLSAELQNQVAELLVRDGLLTTEKHEELKKAAEDGSEPFLSLVVGAGGVSDESLTKAVAEATKVPYVNLDAVQVKQDILGLLSRDIAERYMAVPLGEMQNRLVVAMLDADNVQAVDFLSNKIGRPLKVYMASESGIRKILKQYDQNVTDSVSAQLDPGFGQEETEQKTEGGDQIKTIVQDSPISKALTTILEFADWNPGR